MTTKWQDIKHKKDSESDFATQNPYIPFMEGHQIGDLYKVGSDNRALNLVNIEKSGYFHLVNSQGYVFIEPYKVVQGLQKLDIRRIDFFAYRYGSVSKLFHTPLSNFWPEQDGLTLEHSFAAAKTHNLDQKQEILKASTPNQAKKLGRAADLRPDWDEIKYDVMVDLVMVKFFINKQARDYLLATDQAELIEGNWWNDRIWGKNLSGQGKNWLGEILMDVRSVYERET